MDVILFDFYENCNYLDVHITFCAFLMAQKVFSQKELDAVLNPVLMEHAEEMLRFERMEINAGTLSEDDKPQVLLLLARMSENRR